MCPTAVAAAAAAAAAEFAGSSRRHGCATRHDGCRHAHERATRQRRAPASAPHKIVGRPTTDLRPRVQRRTMRFRGGGGESLKVARFRGRGGPGSFGLERSWSCAQGRGSTLNVLLPRRDGINQPYAGAEHVSYSGTDERRNDTEGQDEVGHEYGKVMQKRNVSTWKPETIKKRQRETIKKRSNMNKLETIKKR